MPQAEAASRGIKLTPGSGGDPDTLGRRVVYVYDSAEFPFFQAEIFHQAASRLHARSSHVPPARTARLPAPLACVCRYSFTRAIVSAAAASLNTFRQRSKKRRGAVGGGFECKGQGIFTTKKDEKLLMLSGPVS